MPEVEEEQKTEKLKMTACTTKANSLYLAKHTHAQLSPEQILA